MVKNSIILIISATIILLVMSSLVVFASTENQNAGLNNKVTQEIDYLDRYIISLLANFNGLNITNYSAEERSSDIEGIETASWDTIQSQTENLYQTWNTVCLDLNSLGVNGSYILAFSDYLNSSMQNIKNRNKEQSMESLVMLYQLLPLYSESYSPNTKETSMLKIQSEVVTAYVNVSSQKWQEAQTQLAEASCQFTNLLNSVDINFQNQTTVNQCYVLVNELSSAVEIQDTDIFYIEFQYLMEKLSVI